MQRSLLLMAVLLVSETAALPAQQASNDANPLFRPITIRTSTISVPPIPGVPFSATALIENKQAMPDGSVAATRNVNLIGRDSRGRTHGEMRTRVPESFKDMPLLLEVHLYDPKPGCRPSMNPRPASLAAVCVPSRTSKSTPPRPPILW